MADPLDNPAVTSSRSTGKPPTSVLLALVALLPLYCLPDYAYYSDGVRFAADIAYHGWDLKFHPHHLGYSPAGWALWHLLRPLAPSLTPFILLSIISRITGIAALVLVARLLLQQGYRPIFAAWATLLLGSGWTWWSYSTVPATYLPTLCCLLLLYQELLRPALDQPLPLRPARAVLWLTAAVLWHQLAILAVIPAVGWVWWLRRAARDPAHLPAPRAFSLRLVAPAVLIYLLVWGGLRLAYPAPGLLHWATRYGRQANFWSWNLVPPESSAVVFIGELISTSHGTLVWAMPYGYRLEPLTDSTALLHLQQLLPAELYPWLLGLSQSLVLLVAVAGGLALARRDSAWRAHAILALLWLAPFFLFNAAFVPENAFYRLYYLPPLLFLVCSPFALDRSPVIPLPAGHVCCAVFLALTLLTNTAWGWGPASSSFVNPELRAIQALNTAPPMTLCYAGLNDWVGLCYAENFGTDAVYRIRVESLEACDPADLAVREAASIAALATAPPLVFNWITFSDLNQGAEDWTAGPEMLLHFERTAPGARDLAAPVELWLRKSRLKIARPFVLGRKNYVLMAPVEEGSTPTGTTPMDSTIP